MSSPPKPWTNVTAGAHNYRTFNMTGEHSGSGIIGSPAFPQSSPVPVPSYSSVRIPNVGQVPPPIPPRPDQMHSTSHRHDRYGVPSRAYSSFGTYSNPLYSSTYRGYGGMGYGSRMPYGSNYYGAGDGENDLIRFAEESTRPAFQSIESVVHAVGSVSMMLESTFHALYSSYQAVLGVADQFTRLRNQLTHILSTLALLRSMQWLCLKILYYLGVRRQNPSNESAWSAATELANAGAANATVPFGSEPPRSSWPIIIFLSVVLGAPWVILRLLSKAAEMKKKEVHSWASEKDKSNVGSIGVMMYDFSAQYPQEMSVRAGQKISIAPKYLQPKTRGWILAGIDGKKGLVPSNYIKLVSSAKSRSLAVAPAGGIERESISQSSNLPTLQEETQEDKKQPVTSSEAPTVEGDETA